MTKNKLRSEKVIRNKIKSILAGYNGIYPKSPRARSKLMTLEWVLKERSDI